MAFLGSFLGRCILSGSAVLGALLWFMAHERNIGAENVLNRSRKQGAKIHEKVEAARAAIPDDGAFERLRKDYCRNCGKSLPGLAAKDD